ncbi:M48 family metalloprotease [Pelomonas sp. KK5]|uniref:M48 family metalloprotease n=1 Tax=Pelomonas sp. KK5 TaxID=1855730 RepID=UPI00118085F4|nr:M48 family metalloprotease [Pelomonas sp. KK5]
MSRLFKTLILLLGGALLSLVGATSVRAETITDVLARSQRIQLESFELAPPDGREARIMRQSFDALVKTLKLQAPVELHVIVGPVIAETLNGQVLVANARLADAPENVRLFVLAHELGHVTLGHWQKMGLLFQKWVPGEVGSDPLPAPLNEGMGRDASRLATQQEFEADAFAAQIVSAMRPDSYNPQAIFMYLGAQQDTATHPGTQRRLAALRWQTQLLVTKPDR